MDTTENSNDFDLERVLTCFKRCTSASADGSLVMRDYIDAFRELCRFFELTGRLFGFVARDLQGKINVMEHHLNSKKAHHYSTIQDMVAFETATCLTDHKHNNKIPNGCRTLLRLHRSFQFILQFMHELSLSEDESSVAAIAGDVYRETLARHHPWVIQKMAALALYALPCRKDLIDIMCRQPHDQVLKLLGEVVEAGQPIYSATDELYEQANLLNLP
ncbi:hypothetical protein CAPTEDRAFT_174770 [Capitella teleta]|uniref:Glycolipid transfer protein domain-containing protein n=1 Tax=Capitella teleta TaxID=283909 RepID=R7UWU3_CAPTE|nr:hypothetical protein CAPTEDRAFT_174770 [Capitella teleta]|eukprot:ELU10794.1 hypothetical protein CAPTEDRAFT_174770 [Capitella teleta]